MAIKVKYIVSGKPNQIDYLRHELVSMLDTLPGISRAADAQKTLLECMHAEPPQGDEVPVYKTDPPELQSATRAFRAALRRYHRNKPQQSPNVDQACEAVERLYEWYIAPMFGFKGAVGVFEDLSGNHKKVAVEVAEVERDGIVKINYQNGDCELTLTIISEKNSNLLESLLTCIDDSFDTAKSKGVDVIYFQK